MDCLLTVSSDNDFADSPAFMRVKITPQRAAEIKKLAEIVSKHKDDLQMFRVEAWDYSTTWHEARDNEGTDEVPGEEMRMECNIIHVGDSDFFYSAILKHTDVRCSSDYIRVSALDEIIGQAETSHSSRSEDDGPGAR